MQKNEQKWKAVLLKLFILNSSITLTEINNKLHTNM